MSPDTARPGRNRRSRLREPVALAMSMAVLLAPQASATAQTGERPPETIANPHYRKALSRFPDLAACRKAGFLGADYGFFDLYELFDTREELELCHFWMLNTSDDVKSAYVAYLEGIEGISVDIPPRIGPSTLIIVNGSWDSKKYGVPYGSWLRRKYLKKVTYRGHMTIAIGENNDIYSVRIGFSSK